MGDTQITDEILGFSLKFLNINNVGDIVFENYLYTDSFIYVNNNVSFEQSVGSGYVHQYLDRITFGNFIGWQTAADSSRSRQVFRFDYTGSPLQLDVPVDTDTVFSPLQIFVEGQFIDSANYVYEVVGNATIITILQSVDFPVLPGAVIEVQAFSKVASSTGFYQVPLNLESNPLNENSPSFTLGTIRTHYQKHTGTSGRSQ